MGDNQSVVVPDRDAVVRSNVKFMVLATESKEEKACLLELYLLNGAVHLGLFVVGVDVGGGGCLQHSQKNLAALMKIYKFQLTTGSSDTARIDHCSILDSILVDSVLSCCQVKTALTFGCQHAVLFVLAKRRHTCQELALIGLENFDSC